jgi:hypothetical protein
MESTVRRLREGGISLFPVFAGYVGMARRI